MRKVLRTIIAIACISLVFPYHLNAKSSAVKSTEDYNYTINVIRVVSPMIENFGDDALKANFQKIKDSFQTASENYYGMNYDDSAQKYMSLKKEIISLLEKVAQVYLDRTKNLMDSTSKASFEILIKYSKTSGLATYFRKPYDPLNDVKPYNPEDYHFFHHREIIESYLESGYKSYNDALRYFKDPEIALLRKRKSITSTNLNYIIERFLNVAFACRSSKQYGIEIHKLMNHHKMLESLKKYGLTKDSLNPVYDGRIPSEYKVDAIDNIKLIYSVELKRLGQTEEIRKSNGN